ncbi:heterokaryon incompatibility protein-domain-containing protein, partial [Microdochium trichocladiopsis]
MPGLEPVPQGQLPFEYTKLDPTRHEIRLIRLKPATTGPIHGDMIVQSLDHHSFVPYEAVSYVWGESDMCETITVDGNKLPITRSAHVMLDRLCRANHGHLWIDAICINQADDAERGHQVQQMRRVYASATRVIIYLGHSNANIDLLMKGLRAGVEMSGAETQNPMSRRAERSTIEMWWQVQRVFRQNYLNARQRQRAALCELLDRSYFERIWIIQEVSNARAGLVHCGDYAVSCSAFTLAPSLLDVQVKQHCLHILEAMPTIQRHESSWLSAGQDMSLFHLLSKFRGSQATLQRDRIYALLGLCEREGDRTLLVDYTLSDVDVVRHAAAYI